MVKTGLAILLYLKGMSFPVPMFERPYFSSFARDCILNAQVVERVTKEQLFILNELIRERNNLNQIAKACNRNNCWGVAKQATEMLAKFDRIIELFDEYKP